MYFDAIRSYVYYRSGDQEMATDLAQDVFMKLWEKNDRFDASQVKGLLYKMAGDMFVSKIRRKAVEEKYQQGLVLRFSDQTPQDDMEYKELKNRYEKALSLLGENQRVVFLMSRMEGLKYREIADRLDVSQKAVEKRMNQALAFLKQELMMK